MEKTYLSRDRYFLGLDLGYVQEVNREQFITAERMAGFYPKGGGSNTLATGGFFGHGVRGSIRTEWSFNNGETWEAPSRRGLEKIKAENLRRIES